MSRIRIGRLAAAGALATAAGLAGFSSADAASQAVHTAVQRPGPSAAATTASPGTAATPKAGNKKKGRNTSTTTTTGKSSTCSKSKKGKKPQCPNGSGGNS
ncbi:MAG TPA: hypothetical protein VEN99_09420, partial [Acidimicrobiia bacterium]|nr:hypothetical protein [Acidimicrobiia bacterium]